VVTDSFTDTGGVFRGHFYSVALLEVVNSAVGRYTERSGVWGSVGCFLVAGGVVG